ncbi:class I SAM-dependent methyltransferase [Legionella saoudiensis]|uniref:class I SAM-dependent methyltransferase n=1 Tax=Legionella saoudiensis TaxID=1750561 RepID=UPI00072FF2C3|nr:class I SAM-dependent methyltransferase [Legionella saoudiensis]
MITVSAVGYADDNLRDQALVLAEQLHFDLDKDANPCLFLSEDGLALKMHRFSLLSPDFHATHWLKRRQEGKKQGLVRACKPVPGLRIIDATAGWGRDAAVLASFGAQVLMLERHPVMAALLADALSRQDEQDKQYLQLSLQAGNTLSFLKKLPEAAYPDVIYIDPMHPERSKSALVKKDMQALQQMIGADEDALELIETAITKVKQKVVVKWPQKIKPLLPANANIEGKTVRFDIYTPN